MFIKTILTTTTFLTLMASVNVTAETMATTEAVYANKDKIFEARQFCARLAHEEEVTSDYLEGYLLSCVNAELTTEGYQPLSSLRLSNQASLQVMNKIRSACNSKLAATSNDSEIYSVQLLDCVNKGLDELDLVAPKSTEIR